MKLNHPQRLREGARRLLVLLLAATLLAAVGMAESGLGVPRAWASDRSRTTVSGQSGSTSPNSSGTLSSKNTKNSGSSSIGLSINSENPVITATSGYRASITLTNDSSTGLHEGDLSVRISPQSIASADNLEQWSEGSSTLSTPFILEDVPVPALGAGKSATVQVAVDASNASLKAISTWGAKPVAFLYAAVNDEGTSELAQLNTVTTRTTAGLDVSTPPLTITPVEQLENTSVQLRTDAADKLISNLADTTTSLLQATNQSTKKTTAAASFAADHSMLQVIAEPFALTPAVLQALDGHVDALTQPREFDIQTRQFLSNSSWNAAGLSDSLWSAQAARATALKNDPRLGNIPEIACERDYSWTEAGLDAASREGYSVAMAISAPTAPTVHTGRLIERTAFGDITVLTAQSNLSTLAQGSASSQWSTAEKTAAGRTSRFVAQTAIDEAQAPSVDRNLLVSFGANASSQEDAQILNTLTSCAWVKFGTLAELINGRTNSATSSAMSARLTSSAVPATSIPLGGRKPGEKDQKTLDTAIRRLANTQQKINRLRSQLSSDIAGDSPEAAAVRQWLERLNAAHADIAITTLSGSDTPVMESALNADEQFSQHLWDAVSISSPQKVSVFSSTTDMPVIVINKLPVPLTVTIRARTGSNATTITASRTVRVKSNGQAQTTFRIKAIGASTVTASFHLLTGAGDVFGPTTRTQIDSQLTLRAMNGNVLILLAVVLGIVGFWRQFHRRKDPDQ
ncbi:MAG: DUF6049 family protein [Bifidobacteriaceae bacterium]|nr:DUF6049 family protein [Bifidobacteriaceae bacterium]